MLDIEESILKTKLPKMQPGKEGNTHPPLFTPTRFSFSIAILTSSPFVGASSPSKIPLTAKNANVLETTIAALLERPEPGGTVPVTRMSTGTGTWDVDDGEKKRSRTPFFKECKKLEDGLEGTYIIPRLDITLPSQLTLVNIQMPRGQAHGVLWNIIAKCVAASWCEDLPGITSVKVLGYDRA